MVLCYWIFDSVLKDFLLLVKGVFKSKQNHILQLILNELNLSDFNRTKGVYTYIPLHTQMHIYVHTCIYK